MHWYKSKNPGDVDTGWCLSITNTQLHSSVPSFLFFTLEKYFSSAGFSCCVLDYTTKDQMSPTETSLLLCREPLHEMNGPMQNTKVFSEGGKKKKSHINPLISQLISIKLFTVKIVIQQLHWLMEKVWIIPESKTFVQHDFGWRVNAMSLGNPFSNLGD